ncbi:hypothetical protein [Streptomyces sp. NBC_00576]|uniref:hypothetical protein n=1 Tax=Streptomyces sp. NBC_00576 TaxID=2903665 RepID=UPI002E81FD1F|nr:hypothetical protein [Streptomyces sp. NBC_00576]WUB71547.1 hypothetical protein OG734_16385 [Streptomyces sp. NBC_00576]
MRRLLVVGFVPCGLFVGCLWALVRAGSFGGRRSDWGAVVPATSGAVAATLLALTACAGLLALLLQPFQVRAVRVLEGYWDRWPLTARLAGVLVEVQRRRWEALRERAQGGRTSSGASRGAAGRRVRADAGRRLGARPPVDVLLPTALGNALRAGEMTAGERYGLSTLASWPRIYMQVSDRMSDVLRSTRDALDVATNLCWSFLALTVVSATALYDEPAYRWLSAAALLLAAVAYKGAVIAAQSYAGLMRVVFDVHRFDLVDALHLPLPGTPEEEDALFAGVSDLLTGRGRPDLPYDHHRADRRPRGLHPDDAHRAADPQHMDRESP